MSNEWTSPESIEKLVGAATGLTYGLAAIKSAFPKRKRNSKKKTIEQRLSELESDQQELISLLKAIVNHIESSSNTTVATVGLLETLTGQTIGLIKQTGQQKEFNHAILGVVAKNADSTLKTFRRLLPLEQRAAKKSRPKKPRAN